MDKKAFGFKELAVWQRALEFANKVIELCESLNTNTMYLFKFNFMSLL